MANILATKLLIGNKDKDSLLSFDNDGNAKKIPGYEFKDRPAPGVIFSVAEKAGPAFGTVLIAPNMVDNYRFYEFYVGHAIYKLGDGGFKGVKMVSSLLLKKIGLNDPIQARGYAGQEITLVEPKFKDGKLISIKVKSGVLGIFRIIGIK